MELETGYYYHFYNRSNNKEKVFKESSNYLLFLSKYRRYLKNDLSVIAYCLMPTHFHFLIKVTGLDVSRIKKHIGIFLSSYTKSINASYDRNGSLFQKHTKAKCIDDEDYLLTVATYIHQNPIRAGLTENMKEWPFCSYPDYAGLRPGTLPSTQLITSFFQNIDEFVEFSNNTITSIKKEYWV